MESTDSAGVEPVECVETATAVQGAFVLQAMWLVACLPPDENGSNDPVPDWWRFSVF